MLTFSPLSFRLFGFLASLLTWNVYATGTDLELIRNAAAEYVKKHTQVPAGAKANIEARALDNRLQYSLCLQPLSVSSPGNDGSGRYVSVKVSCDDPQGWSLYVPVQTRLEYPVVTATATLAPQTRLTISHLTIAYKEANQLRGEPAVAIEPLLGARVTRRINAGQPILQRNVCLVCTGDPVTITARSGGMEIKTNGQARSNGNLGDNIRVENQRSKRVINATVTGLAQTEVRM